MGNVSPTIAQEAEKPRRQSKNGVNKTRTISQRRAQSQSVTESSSSDSSINTPPNPGKLFALEIGQGDPRGESPLLRYVAKPPPVRQRFVNLTGEPLPLCFDCISDGRELSECTCQIYKKLGPKVVNHESDSSCSDGYCADAVQADHNPLRRRQPTSSLSSRSSRSSHRSRGRNRNYFQKHSRQRKTELNAFKISTSSSPERQSSEFDSDHDQQSLKLPRPLGQVNDSNPNKSPNSSDPGDNHQRGRCSRPFGRASYSLNASISRSGSEKLLSNQVSDSSSTCSCRKCSNSIPGKGKSPARSEAQSSSPLQELFRCHPYNEREDTPDSAQRSCFLQERPALQEKPLCIHVEASSREVKGDEHSPMNREENLAEPVGKQVAHAAHRSGCHYSPQRPRTSSWNQKENRRDPGLEHGKLFEYGPRQPVLSQNFPIGDQHIQETPTQIVYQYNSVYEDGEEARVYQFASIGRNEQKALQYAQPTYPLNPNATPFRPLIQPASKFPSLAYAPFPFPEVGNISRCVSNDSSGHGGAQCSQYHERVVREVEPWVRTLTGYTDPSPPHLAAHYQQSDQYMYARAPMHHEARPNMPLRTPDPYRKASPSYPQECWTNNEKGWSAPDGLPPKQTEPDDHHQCQAGQLHPVYIMEMQRGNRPQQRQHLNYEAHRKQEFGESGQIISRQGQSPHRPTLVQVRSHDNNMRMNPLTNFTLRRYGPPNPFYNSVPTTSVHREHTGTFYHGPTDRTPITYALPNENLNDIRREWRPNSGKISAAPCNYPPWIYSQPHYQMQPNSSYRHEQYRPPQRNGAVPTGYGPSHPSTSGYMSSASFGGGSQHYKSAAPRHRTVLNFNSAPYHPRSPGYEMR